MPTFAPPTWARPTIDQEDHKMSTATKTKPKRWRDLYAIHPAAEAFPLMSDSELDELGADIKANGYRAAGSRCCSRRWSWRWLARCPSPPSVI